MGHKGRRALIDIQLSLHPNKLIHLILCIVMSNPATTHVFEVPWCIVLLKPCRHDVLNLMVEVLNQMYEVQHLEMNIHEQWTFNALNFVWYQHDDINFIIVTYIFCYIYWYNSVLIVFELPMLSIKAIDIALNSEFKLNFEFRLNLNWFEIYLKYFMNFGNSTCALKTDSCLHQIHFVKFCVILFNYLVH